MIPKVIHYCWFGKNKKSKLIEKCINSWKKYCPDYEIIEWNEENFDVNKYTYMAEAYREKKWAFVADVARLDIIYNYGGIYLDTDVELIKPLDDMINNKAFFCFEKDKVNTGLGFGSIKHNNMIKKMLDDYNDIHFITKNGSYDMTTCVIRNHKILKNLIDKFKNYDNVNEIDDITFYPNDYFCPLDYETRKLVITDNTHAIHWYDATWQNKRTKFKMLIRRLIGKKIYNNLKKIIKKRKNKYGKR